MNKRQELFPPNELEAAEAQIERQKVIIAELCAAVVATSRQMAAMAKTVEGLQIAFAKGRDDEE